MVFLCFELTDEACVLYTRNMKISPSANDAAQALTDRRMWDWRAALLVIFLVEISSSRLVITKWVDLLYFTQTLAFAGVIVGLALGYSSFSRKTVIRFVAGYTLVLVPAQLLNAVEKSDWLWQDIVVLLDRLLIATSQFIKSEPVYDDLFFVSIVSMGYWIIGLCAGYWLTRHRNFLSAAIPSGLVMLIVQIFDPFVPLRVWGLAFYIFTALLLLGRLNFLDNHSNWKKSNFLVTPEIIRDLQWGVLAVAGISVFVSWSMPGLISSVKPAAKAWRSFSQPYMERMSDAVSALESQYGKKANGDFYNSVLALGQEAMVGDTPVFLVDVNLEEYAPVRNYWKGRTYDLYRNGRWMNAVTANQVFNPGSEELTVEFLESRQEVDFTFTTRVPSQTLIYTPAETVWVSREGNYNLVSLSDPIKDVTAWFAAPGLLNGNKYSVRAMIANPSIEELRLAGTEYPEWVTRRYLQVPEDITPQLNELALKITEPYNNPYDKAEAITNYLRNEIEYSTEITSTPPRNQDPLLWVLFEYKKGYCMYYASAEILMLRSIGIPARMAVGFVEGVYDELSEQYTVAYKDSHAWPEVYFPGIGWVEFEPTGNQAPLERPETKQLAEEISEPLDPALAISPLRTPIAQEPDLQIDEGADTAAASSASSLLFRRILNYAVILLMAGFSIFLIRRYSLEERLPVYLASRYTQSGSQPPRWLSRWVRWVGLSPVERAFQSINFSLRWLKHPMPMHATSQERANALIQKLPEVQQQASALLNEYQSTMYTRRTGNIATARKAAASILLTTLQTRIKKALKIPDTHYN